MLIGDQGDVRFRAAVLVDQLCQALNGFLRGRAGRDHQLVHRRFGNPGGNPRVHRFGRFVAERGYGHGHGDAVFVDTDRVVHPASVFQHGGIHERRSGVFIGGDRQIEEFRTLVIHRHLPVRILLHPGRDHHPGRIVSLRIVGSCDDDRSVCGRFLPDIYARTCRRAGGQKTDHQTDCQTQNFLHHRFPPAIQFPAGFILFVSGRQVNLPGV